MGHHGGDDVFTMGSRTVCSVQRQHTGDPRKVLCLYRCLFLGSNRGAESFSAILFLSLSHAIFLAGIFRADIFFQKYQVYSFFQLRNIRAKRKRTIKDPKIIIFRRCLQTNSRSYAIKIWCFHGGKSKIFANVRKNLSCDRVSRISIVSLPDLLEETIRPLIYYAITLVFVEIYSKSSIFVERPVAWFFSRVDNFENTLKPSETTIFYYVY